jgi:prepilin-type N-terminal cleavage/methylation domain-containing protein
MRRDDSGFTLMELLVSMIIAGIIAAMAAVNYTAMQKRAREASTKANMHSFQLAAEDFGLLNGAYSTLADSVAALLPQAGANFRNPFTRSAGRNLAWRDQSSWQTTLLSGTTTSGIVAYGDSARLRYQIVGRGAKADLTLRYSGGK